jgi:hypothetical protein
MYGSSLPVSAHAADRGDEIGGAKLGVPAEQQLFVVTWAMVPRLFGGAGRGRRDFGVEATIMATTKSKAKKPKNAALHSTASKNPSTKPAKKMAAPKEQSKEVTKKRSAAPLKTFAEKVRDGDAGTEVWFRVGDGVARGKIRGRGGPLNGAIDGLGEADIFETEAQARRGPPGSSPRTRAGRGRHFPTR